MQAPAGGRRTGTLRRRPAQVLAGLCLAGVAEITVLVMVSWAIGALPTLGLLVLGAVIGSWLLRREGGRALREAANAAFERRPPARELIDRVLVAAAGVLIMAPGLISDLAGIVFLLPPIRGLLRRRLQRAAERRAQSVHARVIRVDSFREDASEYVDGEVLSVEDADVPRDRT